MTPITEGAVLDALRSVQEPELGRDIVTLEMVKSIAPPSFWTRRAPPTTPGSPSRSS